MELTTININNWAGQPAQHTSTISIRLYTVREVCIGEEGKLFINTVGEFQGHKTKYQAVKFAKTMVDYTKEE